MLCFHNTDTVLLFEIIIIIIFFFFLLLFIIITVRIIIIMKFFILQITILYCKKYDGQVFVFDTCVRRVQGKNT